MFKFAVASLLAVASLVVAQNDPSINSPASVVQCQPVQLSWTATKEPVYISIIPGGQPGAVPIEDFGVQKAGTKTLTWTCDIKARTSITFQIKDSDGAVAYSGNVNVQDSSDKSCLRPDQPAPPASSAAPSATQSSGGASSAPAPAPAPGTTTAAAPPANTTRAADSSVSSRAPAAATSATPTSTVAAANAALPGTQIGWTGLMGVLAAYIVV